MVESNFIYLIDFFSFIQNLKKSQPEKVYQVHSRYIIQPRFTTNILFTNNINIRNEENDGPI